MIKTEYSRKVDSSGRIIVPAQLRDQLCIRPGDSYEFYLHEIDNRTFLCIECYNLEDEIERAKRILREAGVTSVD